MKDLSVDVFDTDCQLKPLDYITTNLSAANGNLAQKEECAGPNETLQDDEHLQNVYRIPSVPVKQAINYKNGPPLRPYELDRLRMDVDLQTFGKGLQQAAEAIFPNDDRSRYSEVHVLLLSWEDEDPKLPVSLEILQLLDLFQDTFGFETSTWKIPTSQSHRATNRRVDEFLGEDDPRHLKIVYYAGHGRLTSNGQLAWTSQRNSDDERCPVVKWSGIQSNLEEAQSDVLLLLDCCAAGTANTNEGHGVTELLAACAFNGTANGVGPYSFTHALINQLRILSSAQSFSIAILFNRLYSEIEGWRLIGKDLQRPPVHLVLCQDLKFPRSIQLCKR
ncbi:hypothetical protein LSUE1_G001812 [Lachnellula suecica]|uniref:Uncharacterized protein n=1 Tax=Lachnellula suecica TaxID=602035 RepID=A0A8T9CA78_9HELO|nr:hypothetical protein LSUE1_G001812 [Lachnellula suecica]